MHIEQVLGDVPAEQRCRCGARAQETQASKVSASVPEKKRPWWQF
jgi:hypothetical protein